MEKKKIYVVFKKVIEDDDYCDCCRDTNILAVCNDPKKALTILENEFELCRKNGIPKKKCLLYVEIFNNFNQVQKKNKKVFNIFQFKKMVKTLLD